MNALGFARRCNVTSDAMLDPFYDNLLRDQHMKDARSRRHPRQCAGSAAPRFYNRAGNQS